MDTRHVTRERRDRVLALMQDGIDTVESLSLELGVSGSTIRRDLAALRHSGSVARTYGGAVLATSVRERTFDERQADHSEEKDAIARVAVGEVEDGQTIYLDDGSTVARTLSLLVGKKSLRLVSRSLALVSRLLSFPDATVIVIGGDIRMLSQSTVGGFAEDQLRRITFDHAFLGADGVRADFGLCERDFSQTRLKEVAMERARRIHVLADATKLDRAPFNAWAPLRGDWRLVTDQAVMSPRLDAFRKQLGDRLVVARPRADQSG